MANSAEGTIRHSPDKHSELDETSGFPFFLQTVSNLIFASAFLIINKKLVWSVEVLIK